jgi:hypothetical protein
VRIKEEATKTVVAPDFILISTTESIPIIKIMSDALIRVHFIFMIYVNVFDLMVIEPYRDSSVNMF